VLPGRKGGRIASSRFADTVIPRAATAKNAIAALPSEPRCRFSHTKRKKLEIYGCNLFMRQSMVV